MREKFLAPFSLSSPLVPQLHLYYKLLNVILHVTLLKPFLISLVVWVIFINIVLSSLVLSSAVSNLVEACTLLLLFSISEIIFLNLIIFIWFLFRISISLLKYYTLHALYPSFPINYFNKYIIDVLMSLAANFNTRVIYESVSSGSVFS